MGVIGRYIDAISDVQRDRIVEAQGWCWEFTNFDDPACHCLVGHAEACDDVGQPTERAIDARGREMMMMRSFSGEPVFLRFMTLRRRFRMDRIVRLCKTRAAKGNNPTILSEKDTCISDTTEVGANASSHADGSGRYRP